MQTTETLYTRLAKVEFCDMIAFNSLGSYYIEHNKDLTRQLAGDMVVKPARDQRTPSQSHSSGSYLETGMGLAERLDRNGWEPFGIPVFNKIKSR